MRSCRAPSREWRLQWNDFLRQSQCCFYKPRWSWPGKTTSCRSVAKNDLHKEQQKVAGLPMLTIAYPHWMQWCFWNLLDTSSLNVKLTAGRTEGPIKDQQNTKHQVNWRAVPSNFGLTSRSGVVAVGVAGSKRPRCRWTKFLCHATFGKVGVNIEFAKGIRDIVAKLEPQNVTTNPSLESWRHSFWHVPRLRRAPGYIPHGRHLFP